jgi:hypothetical protein
MLMMMMVMACYATKVEALVSECGVSPLLPGVVRKLWFRYLTTREGQVANNEAYRSRLANRSSTPHHHLCRALYSTNLRLSGVRAVRAVRGPLALTF